MTIGLVLGTLGLVALGIAGLISANGQKAGIEWVLAFEFLNAFGFANLFPVGLALYARSAPKAVAGTMMGVYYLNLFMCNNLVGWLGGLVERMSGAQFWFLHVALVGGSALVMFVIARLFGNYLLPDELATST